MWQLSYQHITQCVWLNSLLKLAKQVSGKVQSLEETRGKLLRPLNCHTNWTTPLFVQQKRGIKKKVGRGKKTRESNSSARYTYKWWQRSVLLLLDLKALRNAVRVSTVLHWPSLPRLFVCAVVTGVQKAAGKWWLLGFQYLMSTLIILNKYIMKYILNKYVNAYQVLFPAPHLQQRKHITIHFRGKSSPRLWKQCLSHNSTPLPGQPCLPITRIALFPLEYIRLRPCRVRSAGL